MKYAPQLCQPLDLAKLDEYASDPAWFFEQKLDGQRLLIRVEDTQCWGLNRRGDAVKEVLAQMVAKLAPFLGRPRNWCFDGEVVGGIYYLFDMPEALSTVSIETPLYQRRYALEAIFTELKLGDSGIIRLTPQAQTAVAKRELVEWAATNYAEGIVVKRRDSTYHPARRHADWLKAKFVETVDCVVYQVGRQGKESCSVALFEDGKPVPVGHVKMTNAQLEQTKVGDVIEVRYLYMTPERRLYQAFFMGNRTDKDPYECTIEQCKITTKKVRASAHDTT